MGRPIAPGSSICSPPAVAPTLGCGALLSRGYAATLVPGGARLLLFVVADCSPRYVAPLLSLCSIRNLHPWKLPSLPPASDLLCWSGFRVTSPRTGLPFDTIPLFDLCGSDGAGVTSAMRQCCRRMLFPYGDGGGIKMWRRLGGSNVRGIVRRACDGWFV